MTEVTAALVREIFSYDADEGALTWRSPPASRPQLLGLVAGTVHADGRRKVKVAGRALWVHRVIWLYVHGRWPAGVIDHINGDNQDHRIVNLRDVTPQTNAQNQRRPQRGNVLGVLGVSSKAGRKTFDARIKVNGVVHCLGSYVTAAEASVAYWVAKRQMHAGCVA